MNATERKPLKSERNESETDRQNLQESRLEKFRSFSVLFTSNLGEIFEIFQESSKKSRMVINFEKNR